jgi:hypothetical protein
MKYFILLALLFLSLAAHAQCGPPTYAPPCSLSPVGSVAVVPYVLPIPSWGPNTCDSTTIFTLAQCGNFTGAGTWMTTNDAFQSLMMRVTDVNNSQVIPGVVNYGTIWQTADEPSVNLWNDDDSAFMLVVNGGSQYIWLFNGVTAQLLQTSTYPSTPPYYVTFPKGTVFSWTRRDHVFTLDNSTGPGIYLDDNTINLNQGHGAISNTSQLFDFTNSQCLMNTANGYPTDPLRLNTINSWSGSGTQVTFQLPTGTNIYVAGQSVIVNTPTFPNVTFTVLSSGLTSSQFKVTSSVTGTSDTGTTTGATFPLNQWNGALSDPKDESDFGVAFSVKGGQGSGCYQTRWTPGETGCHVWNTCTGQVSVDGALLGTVTDIPYGGAYGGKGSRWKVHDSNQPNPSYTEVAPTQSTFIYGTYYEDDYIWDGGLNAIPCGTGAPNWVSGKSYNDGDRIIPLSTVNNPGGYIFQIIDGIPGHAGTDITIFKSVSAQTPGSDTEETTGTGGPHGTGPLWRNVGIGSSTTPYFTYSCAGHKWKGSLGFAWGKNYQYGNYANTHLPRINLGPQNPPGTFVSSPGDQHLGNTANNANDTIWMFIASSDEGPTTDLLHGTLPGALYMEDFVVAPPYRAISQQNCFFDVMTCNNGTLGQVRRFNHTFATGWHRSFDVYSEIAVQSQTGKYLLLATDGMCQFGSSDPAGKPKANCGGPKWNANDTADFCVPGSCVAGQWSILYPNLSNDTNDYLYQVQSCAGSCATGATQPNWSIHQCTTVPGTTFVDGTITWGCAPDVNNPTVPAQQNSRAEVMMVQTFRGSTPTPTTTAPAVMFVENEEENTNSETKGGK